MGEQPETIRVVGAPGLDNQYRQDLPDRDAMAQQLGIPLDAPLALVTMHPTTLGGDPMAEVEAVAGAIERVAPAACVITQPNADEGGESIRGFWQSWCASRPRVALVDALGETAYWALLQQADVVLGNSSSGIVEAAPIGVPVVNVGDRQRGRLRFGRVWDAPADARLVEQALREAIAAGRSSVGGEGYPPGPAAPRIVAALEGWVPPVPLRKQFRDDVVDKRGATRG
jgi:UDP-N-acetylglucosamine 2-epimerase (non-hydrolysing)/GDP/UDP-N,N'-diacetylbacillosamine 2-epimerase (hydrolysing)